MVIKNSTQDIEVCGQHWSVNKHNCLVWECLTYTWYWAPQGWRLSSPQSWKPDTRTPHWTSSQPSARRGSAGWGQSPSPGCRPIVFPEMISQFQSACLTFLTLLDIYNKKSVSGIFDIRPSLTHTISQQPCQTPFCSSQSPIGGNIPEKKTK